MRFGTVWNHSDTCDPRPYRRSLRNPMEDTAVERPAGFSLAAPPGGCEDGALRLGGRGVDEHSVLGEDDHVVPGSERQLEVGVAPR